jgi:hypothetical protein
MIRSLLKDSFSFFKKHLVEISTIVLPIIVPIEIFTALYQYFFVGEEFIFSEQSIPITVSLVAYPIYTSAIIFYISSTTSGEVIYTKALWKLGVKFWLPYVVLNILVGAAVMCGFILLVIPGIALIARYSLSDFELLLSQEKPLDSMKNSWRLTKQYMWVIIGGYTVITLALYSPYQLIAYFFEEPSISYRVLDAVSNMAYSVLGVLYTIFAFRVYEAAKLQHNQSLNQDAP